MSYIVSHLHPFLGRRLLHDSGIKSAFSTEKIRSNVELLDEQFQPNTLDVRIGEVHLYDTSKMQTSNTPNIPINPDLIKPTTIFPDEKGIPIIIPPNCFAEFYLHENLEYNHDEFELTADFKSSKGRLGLNMQSNYISQINGKDFIGIWNYNPNPILLYGRDRFAQLFFWVNGKEKGDGRTLHKEEHVNQLCQSINPNLKNIGPYAAFQFAGTVHKFKENLGVIDSSKKYPENDLFDIITDEKVTIYPHDCIITKLDPQLTIPNNVGLMLLHNIPFKQKENLLYPDPEMISLESHSLNAGWVDSGYIGHATAHVRKRKFPKELCKGDIIALGILVEYDIAVNREYGASTLKSNYQNNTGVIAPSR